MASTVGGQRRILKHQGTVVEYIRKAVESGVYRTKEELEIILQQRKDGVEDLRVIMNRLRQDVVRGSHIQDYPTEYLILEQHPPIPDPYRTPVRILRQLRPPPNPLHKLTKKYIKRYERENSSSSSVLSSQNATNPKYTDPKTNAPVSSEEYYRRLLGVQQAANATTASSTSSGMGGSGIGSSSSMLGGPTMYQKPALVQKAYAAAVLHYELQQQQQLQKQKQQGNQPQDQGNHQTRGTDQIMKQVDEMLSQQVSYEQSVARERRNNILRHALENSTGSTETTSSWSKKLIDREIVNQDKSKFQSMQKSHTDEDMTDDPRESESISAIEPLPKLEMTLEDDNRFNNNNDAAVNDRNRQESYTVAQTKKDNNVDDDEYDTSNTIHSIFHSDPNTIEGMMRWSERLNAVPYAEWTIGASTALDHWIARQVLKVSEVTWQSTLESYDTYHLNIGRDIVACREAIFPETIVHANRMQQEMDKEAFDDMKASAEDALQQEAEKEAVDKDQNLFGIETSSAPSLMGDTNEARSIEDLLQRLGGLRAPDAVVEPLIPMPPANETSNSGSVDEDEEEDNDVTDLDLKINKLVHELQNWRRRNMELPYEQWENIDQEKFRVWMKKYVSTVSSEAEKRQRRRNKDRNNLDMVDYEETRIALLADPPMSADESNEFWSQLQDESMIEILLDNMIDDGPPAGASILHKSFWDLPRTTQLEQLLNLGAIRPLLDEYTKETDRLRFLQRYGDAILTGVPLEHLVPDPSGPIRSSDLSRDIASALQIGDQERFRLEKIPYKAYTERQDNVQHQRDAFERSRALFKAWNTHKAGRARYEEKLFHTGRLGLRYNDELDINAKKAKSTSSDSTGSNPSPSSRRQR